MKVYYDKEHESYAVFFDKDDTFFAYYKDDGIEIHSCKGGKPEWTEKQLKCRIEDD